MVHFVSSIIKKKKKKLIDEPAMFWTLLYYFMSGMQPSAHWRAQHRAEQDGSVTGVFPPYVSFHWDVT